MLELLISLGYVAIGILLFKIDIEKNLTGFLKPYCLEGAGFALYFIFYAALSPLILIYGLICQFKMLMRIRIVKWCCCVDNPHCAHNAICGGCQKYSYKLIIKK